MMYVACIPACGYFKSAEIINMMSPQQLASCVEVQEDLASSCPAKAAPCLQFEFDFWQCELLEAFRCKKLLLLQKL
jgi:hypothetical protein